jgi:hypothetical protein
MRSTVLKFVETIPLGDLLNGVGAVKANAIFFGRSVALATSHVSALLEEIPDA